MICLGFRTFKLWIEHYKVTLICLKVWVTGRQRSRNPLTLNNVLCNPNICRAYTSHNENYHVMTSFICVINEQIKICLSFWDGHSGITLQEERSIEIQLDYYIDHHVAASLRLHDQERSFLPSSLHRGNSEIKALTCKC